MKHGRMGINIYQMQHINNINILKIFFKFPAYCLLHLKVIKLIDNMEMWAALGTLR